MNTHVRSSIVLASIVCSCSSSPPPATPNPTADTQQQRPQTFSLQCPEFPRGEPQHAESFDKSCTSDADCAVVTVGCGCAPDHIVGVNQKDRARFSACADCPAVQCAQPPSTADDGKPVGGESEAKVACVARTCVTHAP